MLAFLVAVGSVARGAPPEWTELFPSGGRRGTKVEVKVTGKLSTWPAAVWSDRNGLTIEPAAEKGQLAVAIAADAAPGLYWLRLHNADGGSTPRPFIVGGIAESLEKEPNDAIAEAQLLRGPVTVNGRLGKRGDVDGFSLNAKAGQVVVAALDGHRSLGSPMDAVLQICSADGFVLAQNDDGRGLDPLLTYLVPHDGVYVIRTFAFPATPNSTIALSGASSYVYRLTITNGPFVDHGLPMAAAAEDTTVVEFGGWNLPDALTRPFHASSAEVVWANDERAAGHFALPVTRKMELLVGAGGAETQLKGPSLASGRLALPGERHVYAFTAKKSQKWEFRVESQQFGFPLDATLQVTDTAGKVLSEIDDTSRKPDPTLTFTAPAEGSYRLAINDLHDRGGLRFVYRLFAGPQLPDFGLSVDSHAVKLKANSTHEVTVKIVRLHGFAEPIEVSVESLPAGVSAMPITSTSKGETAKSVKLVIKAGAEAFSGPIRIVGIAGSRTRPARFPIATHPGTTLSQLWLNVDAK